MNEIIIFKEMEQIFSDLKVLEVSKMKSLSLNNIFLVRMDSGEKFIFKAYPADYKERMEKEVRTLKELEQEEIPSPRIVYSNVPKLLLVEEYIKGQLLFNEINNKNFNPKAMNSVGKILAKIHLMSIKEAWQDRDRIETKADWIKSVKTRNESNLKDLKEYKIINLADLKFILEYLKKFSEELECRDIFLCPIHGDYNPRNILIEGVNVKGIFDFENIRIAHNLNDLGIVYYWYKFYDKGKLFSPFLEGYSKSIRITQEDQELIKVYYLMQVIGALSFLLKKNLDRKAIIKLKKLLEEFLKNKSIKP